MILFITSHDEPTRDNWSVANHLQQKATTALCKSEAIRANIIAALSEAISAPLFALAHGKPSTVIGHDGNVAISASDKSMLATRKTFAFSCHTAGALGPSVATDGGTWFGYAGPINCLPADKDSIHHFRSVVDFLADRFPSCNTALEADSFISDLGNLTDQISEQIEESATFEQLHTLRDITRRLRIWLPGSSQALKHPEATPDPIV